MDKVADDGMTLEAVSVESDIVVTTAAATAPTAQSRPPSVVIPKQDHRSRFLRCSADISATASNSSVQSAVIGMPWEQHGPLVVPR